MLRICKLILSAVVRFDNKGKKQPEMIIPVNVAVVGVALKFSIGPQEGISKNL